MLAGLQRRDSEALVHIGPGADHQRIDLFVVDDIRPSGVDLRNAESLGNTPARFGSAVADGHNLHAVDGLQARNVFVTRVGAGTDDPDADLF